MIFLCVLNVSFTYLIFADFFNHLLFTTIALYHCKHHRNYIQIYGSIFNICHLSTLLYSHCHFSKNKISQFLVMRCNAHTAEVSSSDTSSPAINAEKERNDTNTI